MEERPQLQTHLAGHKIKKTIKHPYDSTFIGFTITWSASVTGTINHKINGDSYANEWTNYVNL